MKTELEIITGLKQHNVSVPSRWRKKCGMVNKSWLRYSSISSIIGSKTMKRMILWDKYTY